MAGEDRKTLKHRCSVLESDLSAIDWCAKEEKQASIKKKFPKFEAMVIMHAQDASTSYFRNPLHYDKWHSQEVEPLALMLASSMT